MSAAPLRGGPPSFDGHRQRHHVAGVTTTDAAGGRLMSASPPIADLAKGYLLPDFYSGAAGIPGRFSDEGLLLRRLHAAPHLPPRC